MILWTGSCSRLNLARPLVRPSVCTAAVMQEADLDSGRLQTISEGRTSEGGRSLSADGRNQSALSDVREDFVSATATPARSQSSLSSCRSAAEANGSAAAAGPASTCQSGSLDMLRLQRQLASSRSLCADLRAALRQTQACVGTCPPASCGGACRLNHVHMDATQEADGGGGRTAGLSRRQDRPSCAVRGGAVAVRQPNATSAAPLAADGE